MTKKTKKKPVPHGYWTVKEHCATEAAKYANRTRFQNECPSAWRSAMKRGWIDEICAHMPKDMRYENQRTKEDCENDARQCHGKFDYKKRFDSSYQKALREKWINDIAEKMYKEGIWKKPFRWNKLSAIAEGRKYNSREDFFHNSCGAYLHAQRHGFLDEACAHMKIKGNKMNRKIYVYEFEDGYAYVGLTFNTAQRNSSHLTKDSPVSRHIKQTGAKHIFKELTTLLPIEKARQSEKYYIQKYKKEGWKMLNIKKGGEIGGGYVHEKEECREAASLCSSRVEFEKRFSTLAKYARAHGWMDEICTHMPRLQSDHTKEECRQEALKYCKRVDFCKYGKMFYDYALKRGWMDEICGHMQPKYVKPTKEEIMERISQYKSTAEIKAKDLKAYYYLCNEGLLQEVILKLHGKPIDDEMAFREAAKYKSRNEFFQKSPKVYRYCKRHGIYEQAVSHMPKKNIPSSKHPKERMMELVKKCPNPFEFRSKYFHEYRAILAKHWFEELFGRPIPTQKEWFKRRR